jgi:hypothetical protein
MVWSKEGKAGNNTFVEARTSQEYYPDDECFHCNNMVKMVVLQKLAAFSGQTG